MKEEKEERETAWSSHTQSPNTQLASWGPNSFIINLPLHEPARIGFR